MKNILLAISVCLLFGCKDEPLITVIQGKVINIGSKEPVDSVKVIAVDGVTTYDAFFGTSNNTGSGRYAIEYTDKEGKFNICIEGNYPCLFVEKKGYRFVVFTEGSSENYKSYIAGKTYKNETLKLWADAFFNGIFKGNYCNLEDSVYFYEGTFIESLSTLRKRDHWWFGNGPHRLPGWENGGWKGIGDKYFNFWMKYQVQGIWHERLDSVFIKSFATYSDTIYY